MSKLNYYRFLVLIILIPLVVLGGEWVYQKATSPDHEAKSDTRVNKP